MRGKLLRKSLLGLLLLTLVASIASAEVKLPGVFGDHMVLQREVALPVWGWADPREKVTVTIAGQTKTATADGAGKWSLKLDALKAGGPHVLKVQGRNTVERSDVLVGEVWLCSGQSNMQMSVGGVLNKDAEIAAADYPQIRMMTVARKTAQEPQSDCGGDWRACSPKTVAGFSAAGYFFGRELHKQLGVPIGLIDSSWGGTPIQAWTSVKAHEAEPPLRPMVEGFKKSLAGYASEKAKEQYQKQLAEWEAAAAKAKEEGKPFTRGKPNMPGDPGLSPNSPGRLYNGMIAPLAPYAIRGAIWYQGESNAGNAALYGVQLRTMITNWRQDWGEGDFPFISVQLPNFMAPQQKPSEMGGWPLIREQFLKSLEQKNVGIAVTIDVGEANDIHPRNKQEVGKRLAMWALAKTYNKDVVACGPLYKSMTYDNPEIERSEKIAIRFDYVGGGLVAKGDKLKGFAIAGEDKKFVWAEANIVHLGPGDDEVTVWNREVRRPVAVRYGWANNPDCNLYNKAGLPASPFRTDDWAE